MHAAERHLSEAAQRGIAGHLHHWGVDGPTKREILGLYVFHKDTVKRNQGHGGLGLAITKRYTQHRHPRQTPPPPQYKLFELVWIYLIVPFLA